LPVGINEQAESGFGRGAATYERGRPSYPQDAIDVLVHELGIGPDRDVLDLAAGTGKLTRLLVPTGARLVAVEPVAAMADQLRAAVPGVEVHDGTAEALPLADDSVDAVLVGQAFHWFDAPVALAECARVLRAGGGLGLIWNERDSSVPWVGELSRLIRWDERERWSVPYTLEQDWVARIDGLDSAFGPVSRYDTTYVQQLDTESLVDRVLSTSYIASQPEDVQADLAGEVRRIVAGKPEPFELPYVTSAFWCHLR
jgi:SAM-dependent methyltransferase